jgi:hypothetical protein
VAQAKPVPCGGERVYNYSRAKTVQTDERSQSANLERPSHGDDRAAATSISSRLSFARSPQILVRFRCRRAQGCVSPRGRLGWVFGGVVSCAEHGGHFILCLSCFEMFG